MAGVVSQVGVRLRRVPGQLTWTSLAPAVVYLVCRGVGILVWSAMAATTGTRPSLIPWDGVWYTLIAQYGYEVTDRIGPGNHYSPFTAQAFFPAFPWLMRWLAPPLGHHYARAALIVTTIAGIAFAYGVRRLARDLTGSDRVGLLAVALAASVPMALVYNLVYPEVLFCALAVWALVALLDQQWLLAGALTCLAGTVRPAAPALIAVVLVTGIRWAWRYRDRRAVWVGLAPLGMVAYIAWVAVQTGSPTGYFTLQREGWVTQLDGGRATVIFAWSALTGNDTWNVIVVLAILATVAAVVLSVHRLPAPVWAYSVLIVAVALGTTGFMSVKPRELLPAFVLLIPLAGWIARQRPAVAIAVVGGFVLVGAWVSSYSLTVLTHAI